MPGLPTPGEREFVTHSLEDGFPVLSRFPMTPGKIAGASGPNELFLPVQHNRKLSRLLSCFSAAAFSTSKLPPHLRTLLSLALQAFKGRNFPVPEC